MAELRMDWRTRYAAGTPLTSGRDPLGLLYVCCDGLPMPYNRFVDRMQRWWLGRFYSDLPLSGRSALDVGCGTGRWCRVLRSHGAQVTGADLSEVVVGHDRSAPEHGGITFVAAPATALGLPDRSFDLVQAVTVLQHIPPSDQPRAAAEMCRVARPDGAILLHEAVGTPEPGDRGVTWPLAPGDWKAMFATHGWVCVREERSLFIPLYRLMLAAKALVRRSAGWSAGTEVPPAAASQASRTLTRWFLVLTIPFFYALEWFVFSVLRGSTWTTGIRSGGTQTFLFRKPSA